MEDAREACEECVNNGGVVVQPPTYVHDKDGRGGATISEVHAYGHVVFRFISFDTVGDGVKTIGSSLGEDKVSGVGGRVRNCYVESPRFVLLSMSHAL